MSKNKRVREFVNVLTAALRHKIGSIVNSNEMYAQKYAKDSEILMKEAKRISLEINLSIQDKLDVKNELKIQLKQELEKKDFLDSKKFEIMDEEIERALNLLNLN